MRPALAFHEVSFRYPVGHVALERVSFAIDPGEAISIIGPNGGGKTTLVKLALGLLEPDSGTIELLGKRPERGCSEAGYVPQFLQVDPKFPISCGEVIAMGLPGSSRHASRKVDQLLEQVGCPGIARRQYSALSGGQRQRVLIARALGTDPEILFLDEPTANVDAAGQAQINNLLNILRTRMTVITVTHDLNLVAEGVNRVLCVDRVVHVHPTESLEPDLRGHLFGPGMALVKHSECLDDACSSHNLT